LAASLDVSTHSEPQAMSPPVQAQVELVHVCPAAHGFPQRPQLASSVVVSTQAPPQAVNGAPQLTEHAPFLQNWLAAQACEQEPQLAGSCWMSTHRPAHVTSGALHVPLPAWQMPPLQLCPLGQAR
jgi:hypothetical protein